MLAASGGEFSRFFDMGGIGLQTAEARSYEFAMTKHRIGIKENLKKHSLLSGWLWTNLQNQKAKFLGVVRDYTAVFSLPDVYVAVHHFIYEKPDERLIGKNSGFEWRSILTPKSCIGDVLAFLESENCTLTLPEQAWLDAYQAEEDFEWGLVDYDWHLDSPKHKLMIWVIGEDTSFLLEFFFSMPIPPYGVDEPFPWPQIKVKPLPKKNQIDLFDVMGVKSPETSSKSAAGEDFEILEQVDVEKLEYARRSIEKAMSENSHILVAYSGGKDSHTCLLLVLDYLLNHPECQTKVTIISASTLVENPLLEEHVRKVRNAVATLPINIPFHIVTPDVENTYMVCVLGRGYQPPSILNKWCVERLKITPADRKLQELLSQASILSPYSEEKGTCLILGTRDAESATRAKSIQKHFGDDFYGKHHIEQIRTAAPIRAWDAKDVATYLVRNPAPWDGYGNYELINLYGIAMAGAEECPIGAMISSENEAVSSCTGKAARMGCYSCTVISSDESLENMALWYEELNPYLEVRKLFKITQDIRYGTLTGYKRQAKSTRFGSGMGDLTIDVRTILLEHMNRLNVRLPQEEVDTIYRFVREREILEGMPVTRRFRNALMKQYKTHPIFIGAMFDPIFDSWGCGVDRITEKDKEVIKRILARQQVKKTDSEG
jgi:DNA sulfur modification protein DndC